MNPAIRFSDLEHVWTFILLLLFSVTIADAQIKPIVPQGVTRAVVIGISNYQNDQITDLRFADKDARAFADYLLSDAGGKLSIDNLRFLANEQATQGQIASAFTWLSEASQAGDKAIIYFSGHGDMETLTGLSFLLAHDASATAYSGGGSFPVVFLQAIITRLTTQKQVQVILITDACRAGKLAGNEINGAQATAKLLSDQFANEVKILSCQPNEFSMESPQWGGGRGVFSYFLLDGLRGLADQNRDQTVSLLEIGRFLEDKVPAAVAPQSQIPMVVGNKSGTVARVDAPTLAALLEKTSDANTQPDNTIASRGNPMPATPDDTLAQRWLNAFKQALGNKQLLAPSDACAWNYLKKLETRPAMNGKTDDLRLRLCAQLQDDAQTAINDYLAADPRELQRRWGFDDRYEKFPEYLEKAAELLGKEHFTYNRLLSRAHYFKGLNLRLQGERTKEKALFNTALQEQEMALQYDRDAVFALNETGHLLLSLQKNEEASTYFEKAIALSPRWVLPWSNLCFASQELNNYEKAEQYGLKAISLDSTFVMALYNLALTYQYTGRLEQSANFYRKTLQYDTEYLKAYFNLGLVYYFLGDYRNAEKTFMEYLSRKPDNPGVYQNLGEIARKLGEPERAEQEFQKALSINPKHAGAHMSLAELHTALGQEATDKNKAQTHFQQAAQYLTTYIQLEKDDAEGYYQMAGVQSRLGEKDLALEYLEKAFQNGFKDKARLSTDPNLKPLSGLKAFKALLERL